MLHLNNLKLKQQILHRPRLHSLLYEGLQHPLLVMLAGPGYGKTQAMADYVAKSNANVLWLHLGALDNLPSHFWEHLLRALKRGHPEFLERFQELEFPDTISSFDIFVRLIGDNICGPKPMIWVFDDYGEIDNSQVKEFVRMLVAANLENLRLVLISNALGSTESIAFMTSKRFLILADDFRFTRDEIQDLYALHGLTLEANELDAVEHYTEGWPLPLGLLVLQHDRLPNLLHQDAKLTHQVISYLFEERFFSAYTGQQQKLFVKLSLLDSFIREFAIGLHEGNPSELEILDSHAFLAHEPATDRYFFHHLYRLFLLSKAYLLSPKEEQDFWQKAAKYYMLVGDFIEAIACFRKAKSYMDILEAINCYANSENEMTETTALYFLEHIDLLTSEQTKEHPIADYLRARIYLSTLELDKSEALLLDLERRLLLGKPQVSRELLIDVYVMLGNIHMMRAQEDFGDYFKKAADYLPEHAAAKGTNRLFNLNIHNFAISDNKPGARERMERAVHNAVPWIAQVLSGGLTGLEYLFSAEADYLAYQLDEAQQNAYRAVYKAEALAQQDIVCNAYAVLARIGFMRGNFAEMSEQIQNVVAYANQYDIGVLKEIRDTALGWYYVKLRDHNKIPKKFLDMIKTEQPMSALGRPQIIYVNYLINTGEYAKVIGMLEYPKGLFLSDGIRPDRICLFVMLAISYHHLGNNDASMDALWSAYDMCYNNKLTMIFIEAEKQMEALIATARKQKKYAFSLEWLNFIDQEAKAFSRRAEAVRAAYRKRNPIRTVKDNPLSKREQIVLQAVAQGLTREEIAIDQYISVNTVKSTIRNIYNKLGANNKGSAISIAIAHGYIEPYTPK